MSSKSKLGQFYTTNYDYILQNLSIPDNVRYIIEPFAGNGDLLKFLKNGKKYTIECYDIDPKKEGIIKRDTLNNPPNYSGKFVLTNPPYLARNKNENKLLYDKYKCNDLYKCFIINIIESDCIGGILIIPLNFISSIRKTDIDLRKSFFNKYHVNVMNIFEERVFDDTTYTVCSFIFEQKTSAPTKVYIYPSEKTITQINFSEENNFTIGGEIYNLPKSKNFKVERATKLTKNTQAITNILLKCIDDSETNKIKLEIVRDDKKYIDNTENLSARSYATLVIEPVIDMNKQKKIVSEFNKFFEEKRSQYNSLFLTNYREGSRKRISFELAFRIVAYLLDQNGAWV